MSVIYKKEFLQQNTFWKDPSVQRRSVPVKLLEVLKMAQRKDAKRKRARSEHGTDCQTDHLKKEKEKKVHMKQDIGLHEPALMRQQCLHPRNIKDDKNEATPLSDRPSRD